ncbi:MAG: EAL domain-containing protein [Pseudomonadota bacterium]
MKILSDGELKASLASPYITVGQIAQRTILECDPATPLYEAAERMSEAGCSSIIVTEAGRAVGIWTERDALRIDFRSTAALSASVSEVMSSPVQSVHADATMQEVASRFLDEGMRHYLVVDDGDNHLGVVSQTDVVLNQGIEHYLRLRNVDSVLKEGAPLVDEALSLGEAARQMREHQTDAVLVRYADGEHGILTERDIVRLIARRMTDSAVGGLASRPLLAVDSDCSLYRARTLLVQNGVRHIGVRNTQGEVGGLISFTDILFGMEHLYVQELQQALAERDQALSTSQRNLHLAEKVIESSLEGILITDADGVIERVNPAFTRLTGYTAEEAIGQTPALLRSGRHDADFYAQMWRSIREDGHWQGEVWNRRKNGEVYPELLTVAAIHDDKGALTHYAALFSDISEIKENEERIRNLAYYDALTGLPNRRLFQDRLSVAIAHAHRNGSRLGVVFVDLDRFKRINDSLGHAMGDKLLRTVTERLLEAVREDDTVARMGGDEFVILLTDASSVDAIVQVARRIIERMTQPVPLGEQELVVTCSLGISFYPDDGHEIDTLIQNADTAMYRAKEAGRNSYQLYSPSMNVHSLQHLALEVALRQALEQGELEVWFQPLLHAESGGLAEAEALIRWHSPTLGWVPPSDFIPLAEETGLIVPIGEFVLKRVCEQLGQWQQEGRAVVPVAINVSAIQFRGREFIAKNREVIAQCGINPELLTFELTESMLVEDAVENIRTMNALRAMGVRLAVDDFGTGYSSLNYLRRFPIDKLKIDRAFIRDIDGKAQDQALVAAVIHLGHSLRMDVVAEGVERSGQVELLREHGCDLLQGFYFSPALDGERFAERYLSEEVER